MPARLLAADDPNQDSIATVTAVGLSAYVSADVAHHVLGHASACVGQGGQLIFLSSVLVRCSCRGAWIDLAGPLANLLLGALALLAARFGRQMAASTRLFLLLTAAFNLFYFAGQLLFDVAFRTDDWAWPLRYFRVPEAGWYALLAFGLAVYLGTVRLLSTQLAFFAWPRARLNALVFVAWVAAGLIAGTTALLDQQAEGAVLYRALPQALLLPLGLLFVPGYASRRATPANAAGRLHFSGPWVAAALLVGAASILLLGPGITR